MINPPDHWEEQKHPMAKVLRCWKHRIVDLSVLRSISTTRAGRPWIHVSVSRPDRLPSWAELSKIKDEFIGKDREAYQVLAAESDHVNVHPNCLHLWSPEDRIRCVANLHDLVNEEAG